MWIKDIDDDRWHMVPSNHAEHLACGRQVPQVVSGASSATQPTKVKGIVCFDCCRKVPRLLGDGAKEIEKNGSQLSRSSNAVPANQGKATVRDDVRSNLDWLIRLEQTCTDILRRKASGSIQGIGQFDPDVLHEINRRAKLVRNKMSDVSDAQFRSYAEIIRKARAAYQKCLNVAAAEHRTVETRPIPSKKIAGRCTQSVPSLPPSKKPTTSSKGRSKLKPASSRSPRWNRPDNRHQIAKLLQEKYQQLDEVLLGEAKFAAASGLVRPRSLVTVREAQTHELAQYAVISHIKDSINGTWDYVYKLGQDTDLVWYVRADSPLGAALIDSHVGDAVTYRVEGEEIEITIMAVPLCANIE